MTLDTTKAEMPQARAQLADTCHHPRGRNSTRSNALMRRLLALWAWRFTPKAQQARHEFAGR